MASVLVVILDFKNEDVVCTSLQLNSAPHCKQNSKDAYKEESKKWPFISVLLVGVFFTKLKKAPSKTNHCLQNKAPCSYNITQSSYNKAIFTGNNHSIIL